MTGMPQLVKCWLLDTDNLQYAVFFHLAWLWLPETQVTVTCNIYLHFLDNLIIIPHHSSFFVWLAMQCLIHIARDPNGDPGLRPAVHPWAPVGSQWIRLSPRDIPWQGLISGVCEARYEICFLISDPYLLWPHVQFSPELCWGPNFLRTYLVFLTFLLAQSVCPFMGCHSKI